MGMPPNKLVLQSGSLRDWPPQKYSGLDRTGHMCFLCPADMEVTTALKREPRMITVYLASPLGFSPEWKSYREKIKRRLTQQGCTILDPWEGTFAGAIAEANKIADWQFRVAAFRQIAAQIGKANEEMIRKCDAVVGVLDGAELDSGTVSEIGLAAGLGKKCYGLRTDFRDSGEFDGLPFNLQVLYWLEASGGRLFRIIEDIEL